MPLIMRTRPDATTAPGPHDPAKSRPCLRCRTRFTSAWAGERICTPCKQTVSWRGGTPRTYTKSR